MAQKVKDWRFVRGYTQVELADKSELSQIQVNTYERGILSSFKHIPELAKGLSISFVVLLPTSKEESYCEDASGEGKILNIMKEYQKIENKEIKDLWRALLTKLIKTCAKKEKS